MDSLKDIVILDLKIVDNRAAKEPGDVADIFIASKLSEDLFDIAMKKVEYDETLLEDAIFKEKMEDHPILLRKIKERF